MPAFVIGQISVRDADRWALYLSRVGETVSLYGGEILFRGALAREYARRAAGDKVVVIRFGDAAAADRWHDSPEYQSLVALRDAGAEVTLVSFSD